MRITTRMMVTEFNRTLNNNLGRLSNMERQASTGKTISKPSDDPVGVVSSLRLRTRLTETAKYSDNIDTSISWMDTSDGVMTNIDDVLQRARELAVSGSNGTQSAESKKAIASEVQQLLEHLQTLANSSYSDKYIFGGTNYTEETFSERIWQGNDSDVKLEIGTGSAIGINTQLRSFFMGNNYVDVITDRMPSGQFTASMKTSTSTTIENVTSTGYPNVWTVRTAAYANNLFNGLSGTNVTASTLPTPDGTTNIGANITLEVAKINYDHTDPTKISSIDVNVNYRQTDSVTGLSYGETKTISLTDLNDPARPGVYGSKMTGANALTIGKDQVKIDPGVDGITINTKILDLSTTSVLDDYITNPELVTGARITLNNLQTVAGAATNLGSKTTVLEPIYQQNVSAGTGLVDDSAATNLVAEGAYNNYNGSFIFEVTQVDAANHKVQVKVKAHLMDKFSGEETYVEDIGKIWMNTDGGNNFVDLKEKTLKNDYADVKNLIVPEGHVEAEYYDMKSIFQFSQMKLKQVENFSVGDRFTMETTPPINSANYTLRSAVLGTTGSLSVTATNKMTMTINGVTRDVTMTNTGGSSPYNLASAGETAQAALAQNLEDDINRDFGETIVDVSWDTNTKRLKIVDTKSGSANTIVLHNDAVGTTSTTLKLTIPSGAIAVPGTEDRIISVTGPTDSNPATDDLAKHWVFSNEYVGNCASLSMRTFYMDKDGNTKNSFVDVPVNALQGSSDIINWKSDSTYINKMTGDGMPANHSFGLTTAKNTSADVNPAVSLIEDTGSIIQTNATTALDLQYNADILLEVIDKVGSDVTLRVTSHQVGKDGKYQSFTKDMTVTAGTPQEITIGDVTLSGLELKPINQISLGSKVVTHVTAREAVGDRSITLTGASTQDPSAGFTRKIVLNPDISYPRTMNMSFFNIDDSGDWNSANLNLNMRGIGDSDTATFETGVNFDTENMGIFQVLRNLCYDLGRTQVSDTADLENLDSDLLGGSIYDSITGCIGDIDDKLSLLVNTQAQVGTKVNRLEMQQTRMNELELTYTELLSNTEDADLAKVLTEMTAQETVYKAALSTGSKIIPMTLVDFLS